MTNLSAEYLLIQGQSRQTANVAPCAPSLATSVLYLDQMEPRALGQGCSPLQRPLLSSCSRCRRSQVQYDLLTPLLTKIAFFSLSQRPERTLSFSQKCCTSQITKTSLDVSGFLNFESYSKFVSSIGSVLLLELLYYKDYKNILVYVLNSIRIMHT